LDVEEYKDIFLAESREYLQALNDSLLKLESEPDNRELVQEIFRSAHSLKGMSATMGYDRLTKLTHEMENILQWLRDENVSLSVELADILFGSLDLLENLIAQVENPALPDIDITPLVERISGQLSRVDSVYDGSCETLELDEFMKEVIREVLERGERVYHVTVTVQEDALLKSVRAYMVIQALEEKGVLLKVHPSVSDLEEELFGQSFSVLYQCRLEEVEIKNCLEKISEIECVQIDERTLAQLNENGEAQSGYRNEPVAAVKEKTVRVDVGKLDKLMNMVGELVINRTQIVELGKAAGKQNIVDAAEQLDRITSDLQGAVMKLRMVPVKQVFDRFPRMVRDLSREKGKKIHFSIVGEDTELDRSIVSLIGDPLLHLLRNAVDHGIEMPQERVRVGKSPEGKIWLEARYEGSNIAVEVRDDGHGLDAGTLVRKAVDNGMVTRAEAGRLTDAEAFRLIFRNGFSTVDEITDLSGRGVGMDAVRKMMEDCGGQIDITSVAGAGTCITLRLPLTLAIIKALLVGAGGETYAVPIENIRENLLITADDIKHLHNQKVISLREDIIPLTSLEKCLMGKESTDWPEVMPVVIVELGEKKMGLVVDELVGQQEVVIKSFGSLLGQLKGVGGATVLGNGRVALILNVATLI
jgi:two-component system chemotaxis sensor kinase CheA